MKKGQAAMEFLMTYGWAILVVLAAVGALAYFGVLSPDKILPERCTGPAGMDCLETASVDTTANTISFALKNNMGFKILVTDVESTSESNECDTVTNFTLNGVALGVNGTEVLNGQNFIITVTCDDNIDPGRVRAEFKIAYESIETGLEKGGIISIRARAG